MRYLPKRQKVNERLKEAMLRLVREYPRYGYKKIAGLLRKEGWKVNPKRVYRLWKEEGLRVPRRRKRPKNRGHADSSVARLPARHINHVWSWDFVSDSTRSGRELRWLVVLDEYSRECLYFQPRRSWSAADVLEVMLELMAEHGIPLCLRSDNGPELTARQLRESLETLGLKLLYIEPGSPWQNGAVEALIAILRDEFLNEHRFVGVQEAATKSERYRELYNTKRPHGSLGQRTPAEAAGRVINNRSLRFELSRGSAPRAAVDNSCTREKGFMDTGLSV